jgi:hypothetical protein
VQTRVDDFAKVLERHPHSRVIIFEPAERPLLRTHLPMIKMVAQERCTFGTCQTSLRSRLKNFITPSDGLYCFTDTNEIVPSILTVEQLCESHADPDDGALYIRYAKEKTFGRS